MERRTVKMKKDEQVSAPNPTERGELSPCPFCGNAKVDLEVWKGTVFVKCRECGASGPDSDETEQAIQDWEGVYINLKPNPCCKKVLEEVRKQVRAIPDPEHKISASHWIHVDQVSEILDKAEKGDGN
jgi:Lar family restriction alleviation protein